MTNEPISALTLFTAYSTADEVEILDVSDTTFASTGTNKRIPFSTLLTMAGVAAGVTTVAGGGTGLTAVGSADQLLGVAHTGGALEYKTLTAGPNVTITPAAGSITIASTGGGGGGGMSNPMTTAGDTIYGGTSGTPERLPIGVTGQVLTTVSGSPAWAAPISSTYVNSVLSGTYNVTSSFSNVGISITLPVAGTYLITGNIRAAVTAETTSAGTDTYALVIVNVYDSTNSVTVPNSTSLVLYSLLQVSNISFAGQGLGPIGPVVYTVSGSTVLQVQAMYSGSGVTISASEIYSDVNGHSSLTAVRIS